jgi:uroporphyrinogen decarboxylase
VAIQGNLDPAVLLAPQEYIRETTRAILSQLGGAGHILNLGHGILPLTAVENAQAFITAGQNHSFTAARTSLSDSKQNRAMAPKFGGN